MSRSHTRQRNLSVTPLNRLRSCRGRIIWYCAGLLRALCSSETYNTKKGSQRSCVLRDVRVQIPSATYKRPKGLLLFLFYITRFEHPHRLCLWDQRSAYGIPSATYQGPSGPFIFLCKDLNPLGFMHINQRFLAAIPSQSPPRRIIRHLASYYFFFYITRFE